MSSDIQLYDVISVKKRSEKLLTDNHNNPDESRKIFAEFIMDWTDSYTETLLQENSDDPGAKAALDSIVKLWVEFAEMEKNLRQWKRAVKVFDDALNDSVASTSGSLFAAYANYYKDRTKLSNAQKVYLRGLTSNLKQSEVDLIWKEYLSTMHKYGSPDLTLDQLVTAISSQVDSKGLSPPSEALKIELQKKNITEPKVLIQPQILDVDEAPRFQSGSESSVASLKEDLESVSSKKLSEQVSGKALSLDESGKTDQRQAAGISDTVEKILITKEVKKEKIPDDRPVKPAVPLSIKSPPSKAINSSTSVDKGSKADDSQDIALTDLDDIAPLDIDMLLARHHTRPPQLFCAPTVEPMVSGLDNITVAEAEQLDRVLKGSQSLVAIKAGAALYIPRERDSADILEQLLDVLEGLWVTQALKERHFDAWFVALGRVQKREEVDHRRAKKPPSSLRALQARADTQNKVLVALINKVFLALLLEQLEVLVTLGLPYFTADTVTRLHEWSAASCSDKPSAAEVTETGGLGSAHPIGDKFMRLHNELEEEVGRLRRLVGALLSLRLCPRVEHTPILSAAIPLGLVEGLPIDVGPGPLEPSALELYHAAMASQRERQREHQHRELRFQKQQEMAQRRELLMRKRRKRRRVDPIAEAPKWDSDGNFLSAYEDYPAYDAYSMEPKFPPGFESLPVQFGKQQPARKYDKYQDPHAASNQHYLFEYDEHDTVTSFAAPTDRPQKDVRLEGSRPARLTSPPAGVSKAPSVPAHDAAPLVGTKRSLPQEAKEPTTTSTPVTIHQGSIPLLQKLASLVKNAKKPKV